MSNLPLMHLTPTTCKILANYHANNGSPETEIRWLRIALVLLATSAYNDGHYSEEDMHGVLDLAFSDHDDNIRARAYELLKGC